MERIVIGILILYFVVINLVTFFLYGTDKKRAVRNEYRIPERTLILFAFLGGAVGAYSGMRYFHHKTQKPKFKILIPIALLFWVALWVYFAGITPSV